MKKVNLVFILTAMAALGSCKKNSIKLEDDKILMVSTFAGASGYGYVDGTGILAAFTNPRSITSDASGNLYVTDADNASIRKITPSGEVTTFAGNGTRGYADGTGTAARFSDGQSMITTDRNNNLYLTDVGNACIRKITPSGVVTTIAGSPGAPSADGPIATAGFEFPFGTGGIAVDPSNNIYVTDINGLRKITPDGIVSTVLKSGLSLEVGPVATSTIYVRSPDIVIDAAGNIYVLTSSRNGYRVSIQKINTNGIVETFAGTFNGYLNGIGQVAQFSDPTGLAIDKSGNIYVVETGNHTIRKVSPTGFVTLFAGKQYIDVNVGGILDGPFLEAKFREPSDITIDATGNVYVVERNDSIIRKINLVNQEKSKAQLEQENWNKPTGWK